MIQAISCKCESSCGAGNWRGDQPELCTGVVSTSFPCIKLQLDRSAP